MSSTSSCTSSASLGCRGKELDDARHVFTAQVRKLMLRIFMMLFFLAWSFFHAPVARKLYSLPLGNLFIFEDFIQSSLVDCRGSCGFSPFQRSQSISSTFSPRSYLTADLHLARDRHDFASPNLRKGDWPKTKLPPHITNSVRPHIPRMKMRQDRS